MKLQENIKKLRKSRGWSQNDLAEKLGIHLSHINRIEKGHFNPSLDLLRKLSEVFGVSLDSLVGENLDDQQASPVEDASVAQRIRMIESLDPEDRKAVFRVIDSMITKKKILRLITEQENVTEGA